MNKESQRIEQITKALKKNTGATGKRIKVVRSPLRICPLGAHIDHQLGLVTGMTIDKSILLAFIPNTEGTVRVESLNYSPEVKFSLDDVPPRKSECWGNYLRGAVVALRQAYDLKYGIDGIVCGNMPTGGLGSSAAVGVAYLLALEHVNDLSVSPEENIRLDQYIENVYLGLNNGILDQSIILLSSKDHLTFVDCQSAEFQQAGSPLGHNDFRIVVVYSGISQALVGTDYNNRVFECQEAARMLLEWAGEKIPESPRLRMVKEELYWAHGPKLPETLYKRATHFFTEMKRVQEGVEAWRRGDLETLGRLISASGASSIDNYECGSEHLTSLYNILNACPGVYGARFSGAGFRGCCIGLVDPTHEKTILERIQSQYPQAYPEIQDKYSIYFCDSNGNAQLLTQHQLYHLQITNPSG